MRGDWPSSRTYVVLTVLNWFLFLALVVVLAWAEAADALPRWARAGIVLAMAATVAAQFVAAYRSVAREDEFVRGLTIKCGIAAIGVTLTGAVLWGLGQQFLGFPQVPMWVVYPFFWGTFGMVSPFVRSTRA